MYKYYKIPADVIYQRSEYQEFRKSTSCWATMLGEHSFERFRWAEFIADQFGTIRLLQNGLIDTNWIMSQNQLAPIRPCCYRRQIFPNTAEMHLGQRKLQNEWSTNILAWKEVDFRHFCCSDLWYITSAQDTLLSRARLAFVCKIPLLARALGLKTLRYLVYKLGLGAQSAFA